jgi:LPXTG-site transpeptidase (sortase) family protein
MTPGPARAASSLALVTLFVGLTGFAGCAWDSPTVEHVRVRPVGAGSGVPARPYVAAAPVLAAPAPVAISIPAIGLGQPLVLLGLEPDGTMEVPGDFAAVGWFRFGPRPGENGPAVIAGHIDSKTGPAAFYRLHELEAGDEVRVTREDGSVARFVVRETQSFAKRSFPTERVFGPTARPELRLITCTGAFDWSRRSYVENLVVFAALA